MKAVLVEELGGPENLILSEVPDPGPPGPGRRNRPASTFPDVAPMLSAGFPVDPTLSDNLARELPKAGPSCPPLFRERRAYCWSSESTHS